MLLLLNNVSRATADQAREVAQRAGADYEAWHAAAAARGKGVQWMLAWIFAGYQQPPAWLPPPVPEKKEGLNHARPRRRQPHRQLRDAQ